MNSALVVTLGVVAVLALAGLGVLVGILVAERRHARRELADTRAELEAFRQRLDELPGPEERAEERADVPVTEYVITGIGVSTGSGDAAGSPDDAGARPGETRAVLSAMLAESLVKAAAFGYGVRRALAPETRNRIGFEMRREVRRSRKQRKRDGRTQRRDQRRDERLRQTGDGVAA